MDTLLRSFLMFVFIMVVFRLSGKRTLQEATIFDFVMLLIISETTQHALVDDDASLINGFLVITMFVMVNIGLSLVKQKSKKAEKFLDGVPEIVVERGKPDKLKLKKARIDEEDILESAREKHGLSTMDDIKYAILEKNGTITIVPFEEKEA
jgi:uncharacterized membrane protein YcaP (DUF421 family)